MNRLHSLCLLVLGTVAAEVTAEVTAEATAQDTQPRASFRSGTIPDELRETRALAAADIDSDGDLDIVLGNVGQTTMWLNDGTGQFELAPSTWLPKNHDETNGLVAADFDGDGDVDLFLANGGWYGGQSRLWWNDGTGRFAAATEARLPYTEYTWANGAAAGDLDGDGDLDLVTAKYNKSQLLINDGHGRFTAAPAPKLAAGAMNVALGDIDNDGDLDAVFAVALYESNRVWLNQGDGSFVDATQHWLPGDSNDTLALELADVDGDRDLDLVCANGRLGGEQSTLYLNEGGRLRDATNDAMPRVKCQSRGLAVGDVDGDGHVDIVFGNSDGQAGAPNHVWWNDGAGRFSVSHLDVLASTDPTHCVLLADLGGDDRLEIVFGNSRESGAPNLLLVRDD